MGMRPGKVHANLASGTEMLTGVMLAVGLLTPFAAAGIIGVMVVAGWTVHRNDGFFIVSNGWEYTFIVGLIAAAIAGLGPGRWSIDQGLGLADDLNGWTGLAIALVLGIVGGVAQIVLFYKPDPAFDVELSWRFPNWHDVVADEIASLRRGVGLAELSGFNRLRITGPDPMGWLDTLTCSRVPTAPGKVGLCYFLTGNGNVAMEATVVELDDGSVWFSSAAAAQDHDRDWLTEHCPADSGIDRESLTDTHATLVIAGPRTRDLLAAVSPRTDWSQRAAPWLTARRCSIGHVEAVAMVVSFSGEQAVELHVPNTQLHAVFELLDDAGRGFDLGLFGNHAIESMRLEKGYCHWKAELITEFNPFEAGLERFVELGKDFPGKDGLERQRRAGNRRELAVLRLDSRRAPAHPGETVFDNGRPVGVVTSGAWGHRTDQNLAFAYLEPSVAGIGTELEVLLIGEPTRATVTERCSYDPEHLLPRGRAVTPSGGPSGPPEV